MTAVTTAAPLVAGRPLWHRLLRRPAFTIGSLIVLFWIVMAIGWRAFAPHSPVATDALHTFAGPSGSHLLGTDDLGRDVFSRVLAGSSSVLVIAPLATIIGMVVGVAIGLLAAHYRGVVEEGLMRLMDTLLAVPLIIIAILVLSMLGPSRLNLILVIAFTAVPLVARTVRSAALTDSRSQYVEAALLRGERAPYILVMEVLPNLAGPIAVEATIRFAYAIFATATLSFLGFGVQPPSPDWGLTIASEWSYLSTVPWASLGPALALASLVVGVYLISDELDAAFTQ